MRVVAGKYRGKKLKEFELSSTRPTLDRVKEAIFSVIQFDILNSVVLDLFSGTGALGIEAISRGAKKVYFIDKEKSAIKIINENLKNINEDFEVVNKDYMLFLQNNTHLKFDIVLLDPPFASDMGELAINFLIENDMINKNGIIVFEKSIDKKYEKIFENYEIKIKKYGTVEVLFIKNIK